ncbi:MAG TPA: NADH:ubiquinone reductase (Na(+)-transporting) subunit F, partial [Candidatus Hydrogenedentes bacterium]|nr:NADH:ubiquinone reductase (Na(+)-transporting) subunit F [Candidatus Hydrogenedentota bacterium]
MQIILLGMLMFNIVILSLVVVLMFAKSKLVSSGEVSIEVNNDPEKTLKAPAGASLLTTLANQEIYIPSACGGKG